MMRAELVNAPGKWRRYGWHALLVVVIAGECLAAAFLHQSDAELRETLEHGSGRAQVAALDVLTNRGNPKPLDPATLRSYLDSDNPLIKEWTMTTNFARLAPPQVLRRYAATLRDAAERFRCEFLFRYALGHRNSMRLAELKRFLDSIAPSQ